MAKQITLAVANQKGGSGKTATVAALADAARQAGKNVLAVDLDPQGNLSYTMGADQQKGGAYEMLMGADPAQLIQRTSWGIDLIPAGWSLQSITTKEGSGWRLKRALERIRAKYAAVLIDSPPTAGELQYNALLACTDLVIPLQADPYGLQGLFQMVSTAKYLQAESNPGMRIRGIVLTRYDGRSTLNKQMADIVRGKAAEMGLPLLATIREAVAIREAAATRTGIFSYAPHSKPAQDYTGLYQKLF